MRYRMPVDSWKAVINPLDGDMWKVDPIDAEEVRAAAERGEGCDQAWAKLQEAGLPAELHRTFHVMRLAWLLNAAPVMDDEYKMMLCVSTDGTWFVDGNHRAAAATERR